MIFRFLDCFIKAPKAELSFVCSLLVFIAAFSVAAQVHANQDSEIPDALFMMSLEDLMQVQISVSDRSEETLQDSVAAVSIINAEDIKLSGIRTLPELLRLVPGMNVRRIDGNKWALDSRRIPQRFSASMLILKDGRTLYNPLFAGTYWDLPDAILEDIKHIEVIRGPGSSAWGANAITGVINIVTKRAQDTQGGLYVIGAGKGEVEKEVATRIGKQTETGAFRIYGKARNTSEGEYIDRDLSNARNFFPDKTGAEDGINSQQFGFRFDSEPKRNKKHTFQAELNESVSNEVRVFNFGTSIADNRIETESHHFIYSGEHAYDDVNTLNWLGYYDYSDRETDTFNEQRKIIHAEVINHTKLEEHELSVGMYARQIRDDTESFSSFVLDPDSRDMDLYSLFFQNKWSVFDSRWSFLAGLRLEHNVDTDWEYNPTIRTIYRANDKTSYWSAWTRSVRTPSRSNADASLDFGGFMVPISSENLKAVKTHSYELGLRHSLSVDQQLEMSVFYDNERDPLSDTDGSDVRESEFMGMEIEYSFRPKSFWQFIYSLSYLDSRVGDIDGAGESNETLWSSKARSHLKISDRLTWNALVMFDKGISSGTPGNDFPDILRLDTNVIWAFKPEFELQLNLQNLLDRDHLEAQDPTKLNSAVTRGAELLLRVEI